MSYKNIFLKLNIMEVCLVCVMGIPGSGKTFFCKHLIEMMQSKNSSISTLYICFDELFSLEEQQQLIIENKWKSSRQLMIHLIESILNDLYRKEDLKFQEDMILEMKEGIINENVLSSKKCFILIDDNLYYRSMRYEFFQIAKKYICGFSEIYVKCPLEVAMKRNDEREQTVPSEVILNMAAKLEEPSCENYVWEKYTLCIHGDALDDKQLTDASSLIMTALNDPFASSPNNELEKQASQLANMTNINHQVDLILRNIVGEKIKEHKDLQKNESIRAFSARVNSARQDIISDIKMERSSLPQDLIEWIELGMTAKYSSCLYKILSHLMDEKMS